jgi:hypothetical protein
MASNDHADLADRGADITVYYPSCNEYDVEQAQRALKTSHLEQRVLEVQRPRLAQHGPVYRFVPPPPVCDASLFAARTCEPLFVSWSAVKASTINPRLPSFTSDLVFSSNLADSLTQDSYPNVSYTPDILPDGSINPSAPSKTQGSEHAITRMHVALPPPLSPAKDFLQVSVQDSGQTSSIPDTLEAVDTRYVTPARAKHPNTFNPNRALATPASRPSASATTSHNTTPLHAPQSRSSSRKRQTAWLVARSKRHSPTILLVEPPATISPFTRGRWIIPMKSFEGVCWFE